MSLDPVLSPASIAVVGASRRPGTIGWQILDNLLRHGYTGVVYPVNPRAGAVHSIPAYPSVEAIPGDVDLAVVVVPKEHVHEVVEACGGKGVKGLVVITAGFKEVGGAGVERERALVEAVHRHGMRLVGPNCMGVVNTDPAVSMNATFAPTMPPPGPLSFMSQSGALGVTILDYAAEYGIGIHHFVSVGNKPDVSGNDLLEYWEKDEGTRVILMYLENFGNPRRFTRLARKVTPHQAHRGGEVGPHRGRCPGRLVPHRRPGGDRRRHRRPPRPVRRAAGRVGGGALRHRHGAGGPAHPRRQPGGRRDQRRRPRHHDRRRLRSGGAGGGGAGARHPGRGSATPFPRRRRCGTRWT